MKPQYHELPPALGQAMRASREGLGLSKKDFAFIAGMSVRHVSRLENGEQGCSVVMLWQVAHALQTSPAQLLEAALGRVNGGRVR